ncbi:hypothetical protein EVG20_g8601, partial [Dentipellis fragilis]
PTPPTPPRPSPPGRNRPPCSRHSPRPSCSRRCTTRASTRRSLSGTSRRRQGCAPRSARRGRGVGTPPVAGMVRSADEMEGGAGAGGAGDDMPPAKRQRVAKLPGGALYPEQDWISMHPHPIALRVQLPTDETKPEWKLDGSVVTVPELPLNLLVSTLRERILAVTGSTLSASRIRLAYGGKMLTNAQTIAVYNLEDEDLLVMSIRDTKKK